MAKDAYWFPHDSNGRHDPKIVRLRMKHGMAGVGFFWCCIEFLRDQDDYCATVDEFETLEFEMRADVEIMKTIIDVGLLICEDEIIFSQSLKDRMHKWDERKRKLSEAGKRGGRPHKAKKKGGLKQVKATSKPAESNNIRGHERTLHNIIEENKTPKPPKGDSARFKSFWDAFGNKTGIDYARKCFEKAVKNGLPDSDTLVAIIHAQREQRAALKESGAFVPEWPNPSTWLNQGRWKDELPEVKKIDWDGPNGDGIPF